MTDSTETDRPSAPPAKKESLLANLLLNIIIPTLILSKLSSDEYLGTKMAIVVALAFPFAYGIKDLVSSRKVNFYSALGIISIMLTGGIGLLELDAEYMAIKEATIPGILGIATVGSLYTRWPLVRTFVYNDKIFVTEKIEAGLAFKGTEVEFERTLKFASWMIAGSFFVSSILNYVLAKVILESPPGTVAFNEELAKMTALSYPVIVIPSMIIFAAALFYLIRRLTSLTGLTFEEMLEHHK
ncbi:MAG: VC0807 family protein [Alcanivorax sediminis]|uniref:MFS transporter n=1 Tax=Alcanivorax sediminis TaxID=2663008 RepID=A0A6N7LUP6_9GAMM|nr:VC0807 family protein [Alcanivorax sediminis]MQX54013.1 MFS transporter [Alcanivorax sediminis]